MLIVTCPMLCIHAAWTVGIITQSVCLRLGMCGPQVACQRSTAPDRGRQGAFYDIAARDTGATQI